MKRRCIFAAVALLFLISSQVWASPIAYTSHSDFLNALEGATTSVLDFEDQTAGDFISAGDTLGGITFDYGPADVNMVVTDGNQFGGGGPWSTTSGNNFLGTDDSDIFQGGEDFGLSFGPVNAIGMYFITAEIPGADILNDDITLTAGGLSVGINDTVYETLNDGSFAFFLGIIDPDIAFISAGISSSTDDLGPNFLFNVDDITTSTAGISNVPEPSTLLLLGFGFLGMAGIQRKIVTKYKK